MIAKSGWPACAKQWEGNSVVLVLRGAKAGRKRSCANEMFVRHNDSTSSRRSLGFVGFGEVSERRKAPHWHKRPRNRNPRPRRWVLDRPLSSLDDGILADLFRHGGGD